MKLIITIPAYNEERTMGEVISRIPDKIEGIGKIETIVVDDGSNDRTALIAKERGAFVFSHESNKGLGQTFFDGIIQALKMGADIIVNIDGDNQFDPDEISKLIFPILEKKADVAIGTRFKNGYRISNMSLAKKIGNKFFIWLINRLTGSKFTDTQCGFRAYSREAALRLNLFGGFTYTQEVLLDLLEKGREIKEVPISVVYHPGRRSKISSSLFNYGVQALMIILRTFRDYYPMRFFGFPGMAIFSIGFLGDFYSLIFYIIYQYTTPIRMLFFSSSALLIFGLLLLIMALVADMLKRVRLNQEEILYRLRKADYEK